MSLNQNVQNVTASLFYKGIRRVRQMLLSNASLEEVLENLIVTVEGQFLDIICSVLLLDKEKNCLHHGSAPRLSPEYCQAIDGLLIGPEAGSCGTAAFTGKRMIVEDIKTHPYWEPFREAALLAGVRSCWSQPIYSANNQVLGTFALYYREPKAPTQAELDLLEAAAEVAGIAIELKQDADTLQESEDRFRTLAENIPNLAWMANADGWIFWYNKRWYEYTGTTPEQMEGWGWQSVHNSEELPRVMERWTASIASGERFDMIFPLKGADGLFRQFLTRVEPIRDTHGKIIRWFGTNTDVSEHQAIKDALAASEERYRLLLSGITDYAIFMENSQGLITSWDEGAQRLFGYKAEEIVGKPFSIFHLPEDVQANLMSKELETAAKEGRVETEGWRVRKDGTAFRAKAILRAIYDENKQLIGFAKIVQDITEQKKAEEQLIESHKLMSMISYAQGIFFSNDDIYNLFEEPLQQLLDFTASEYGFIGEVLKDEQGQPYLKCNFLTNIAWDEETRKLWEENRKSGFEFHKLDNLFGQVILTEEVVIANDTAHDPRRSAQGRPPGHPPLDTFLGMPFHKNGVMIGMVGIANRKGGYDKTLVERLQPFLEACANIIEAYRNQQKLKKVSEELQKSEAQLRAIMDATPECIKIVSSSGTLEYMNASGLRMVEADAEVLGRACVYDVIAPEFREEWIKNHQRVCQGESITWEFDIIGLQGTRRRMETHAVPLPALDATNSQLSVTRDITEKKHAEMSLLLSEQRYRVMAESSPMLVWELTPKGELKYFNQTALDFLGVTQEHVLSVGWAPYVHPDDVPATQQTIMDAISKREKFSIEIRLLRHDGQYRWLLSAGGPTFDADGELLGYNGSAVDIHEQKLTEKELEQIVTERTAQLQAVNNELESFSYSVSHDLRTPLRSINGFCQAVIDSSQDKLDAKAKDYLERVRKGSQQMASLIDDMLNLSRITRGQFIKQVVNLSQLTSELAEELQQQEPERQVQFSIEHDVIAHADPNMMRLVMQNLIGNAWKFTSKHSTGSIEFGTIVNDNQKVYYVRDDGAGFDMSYGSKLFTEFQRLHSISEFSGSGIGLATVARIIRRHGGTVWAEGEVEKGATFYFTLSN